MDTIAPHIRDHSVDQIDTMSLLRNARRQADQRHYEEFMIVDVDSHHYETRHYKEIFEYIEDPVLRMATAHTNAGNLLSGTRGHNQAMQGRITRYGDRGKPSAQDMANPESFTTRWMDAMGVDITCLFPTPMLGLGMHPDPHDEVCFSRAYNRWLCERVLAEEPRIKSMLYLPINSPPAAMQMIKDFGDAKGVIGFMITSVRYNQLFDNTYMPLYAELQERGLPLAFHSAYNWGGADHSFSTVNKFISAHALGFAWYNILHCTNWIMNGLPERFPKLKTIWIESGLAWVPFLMQRLDNEFMMRSSEVPQLKRLPSDYMRDMYYSSQPMEMVNNRSMLRETFNMIKAETQLLYASDYPHWDMDLPSTIYDLPFLSQQSKRDILGGNAARLFNLENYLSPIKREKLADRQRA